MEVIAASNAQHYGHDSEQHCEGMDGGVGNVETFSHHALVKMVLSWRGTSKPRQNLRSEDPAVPCPAEPNCTIGLRSWHPELIKKKHPTFLSSAYVGQQRTALLIGAQDKNRLILNFTPVFLFHKGGNSLQPLLQIYQERRGGVSVFLKLFPSNPGPAYKLEAFMWRLIRL